MQHGQNRRTALLTFIALYRMQYGYSPSVSEMADALKTARSNIHYHLRTLEEDGRITRTKGVARSWSVA